jgi:glycosyltransferase involved in cell wall biosynthesis
MRDASTDASRSRLGIYVDAVYRTDSRGVVAADRAFLTFACEVGRHFSEVVLFGRFGGAATPDDHSLPGRVRLVALPYYRDLRSIGKVAGSAGATVWRMWKGLAGVDCVWVFGPHPFGLALALMALARKRRVVIGIRQDTLGYQDHRLSSRGRRLGLALFWGLEAAYRLIAAKTKVTVVGPQIAQRYGAPRSTVHDMTVSLVHARDIATAPRDDPPQAPYALLVVGRIDAEKNPFLVLDALAELERLRPGGQQLTWMGRGPLEGAVRDRIALLGLGSIVRLGGYMPFGPRLLQLYRDADAFVHVSLTEGMPQVVVEALACGTPTVATDVGGVSSLVGAGRAALLVPAGDRDALVDALLRITEDAPLRRSLSAAALDVARERTTEIEAERVATFIESRG